MRPNVRLPLASWIAASVALIGCRTAPSTRMGGEGIARSGSEDAGPVTQDFPSSSGLPSPDGDGDVAGESVSSGAVADDVQTIEAYRRAIRPIACERDVRCGSIGASQLGECLSGEGGDRRDMVFGTWEDLGMDAEIEAGRLVYDPEGAAECLTFLRDAPCRFDAVHAYRCRGYWPPLLPGVEPGGVCARWEECIDGYCSAQAGCEGTCVARVATGEQCGSNTLCGEADFCDNGVCVPRRVEGESCPGHWQACRDGLFCEGWIPENDNPEWGHPEVPGVCAARKGPGTSCAGDRSDQICRSDLYCDWGVDDPVCAERLGRDAECRWLYACADGLACIGLKLGGRHRLGTHYGVLEAGRCLPILDVGAACDPEADVTGCPGSMRCAADARVCRSSGGEGDPCESSWVPPGTSDYRPVRRAGCAGSLFCDPETRRCIRGLSTGDRCTRRDFEDEPCVLGRCDERTHRCVRLCDPR